MAAAWSEAAIPDLTGVTAVVTGASGGLGLQVARGLAGKDAHVVLGVRSAERGQCAASAIRHASSGASVEVMGLDLADLASVHRFAEALESRSAAPGLLVNNAGVASSSLRRTADGFELDFGTNHLGHFALTGLLLPRMTCLPTARVITQGGQPGRAATALGRVPSAGVFATRPRAAAGRDGLPGVAGRGQFGIARDVRAVQSWVVKCVRLGERW